MGFFFRVLDIMTRQIDKFIFAFLFVYLLTRLWSVGVSIRYEKITKYINKSFPRSVVLPVSFLGDAFVVKIKSPCGYWFRTRVMKKNIYPEKYVLGNLPKRLAGFWFMPAVHHAHGFVFVQDLCETGFVPVADAVLNRSEKDSIYNDVVEIEKTLVSFGLRHNDLSPQNVFVALGETERKTKIIDFEELCKNTDASKKFESKVKKFLSN